MVVAVAVVVFRAHSGVGVSRVGSCLVRDRVEVPLLFVVGIDATVWNMRVVVCLSRLAHCTAAVQEVADTEELVAVAVAVAHMMCVVDFQAVHAQTACPCNTPVLPLSTTYTRDICRSCRFAVDVVKEVVIVNGGPRLLLYSQYLLMTSVQQEIASVL